MPSFFSQTPFSSPEVAILLISTKDQSLVLTRRIAASGDENAQTPDRRFTAVKRKTYVTAGRQCLENLYQFKASCGAEFVRKLCWKYSDKTKYEAIKSEVNKQELFYRYSTFKASLSRNCFIF